MQFYAFSKALFTFAINFGVTALELVFVLRKEFSENIYQYNVKVGRKCRELSNYYGSEIYLLFVA